MATQKVLIADDETDILDLLEYNLLCEGFAVCRASNGEEALRVAQEERPDIVLLDIMMPRMDGVETCRRLREMAQFKDTLIVFLTARAEEYSEVAGFEAGADDYIHKPLKPRALMTRLRALMSRGRYRSGGSGEQSVIRVRDLEIMPEEYRVIKSGLPVALPRKEFELLHFLTSRAGKVFSREELLQQIWDNVHVTERTVDVHVRKLRAKLGEDYIQTIKGVGYKFVI